MSTKHTPGPWKAESAGGFANSVITAPSWGKPIAMVNDHPDRYYRVDGPATEEGEARKAFVVTEKLANARLIAAAPKLLEALRQCEEYFDARADADLDQDGYVPNEEMRMLVEIRAAIAKAVQS